jgi:hypothetical protein
VKLGRRGSTVLQAPDNWVHWVQRHAGHAGQSPKPAKLQNKPNRHNQITFTNIMTYAIFSFKRRKKTNPIYMNASKKYKTFGCPKCGTDNLATEHQSTTGIICASCKMGFIPVQIYQRGAEPKKDVLIPVLVGLFFLAVFTGFISIWLAIGLTIIWLLATIVWLLRKNNHRS